MTTLFKASAPGSLMLLGEYAVLEGGTALVAAVNRRMTVYLKPRTDFKIHIQSQLGELTLEMAKIEIQAPFQFILAVLKKYQTKMPSGCEITIESEFSDQVGFASSAAVTVALLHAIHTWLELSFSVDQLILEARNFVREVQGVGSGADVAACVLGGVIAYCADPFNIEQLVYDYPLTAIYSGSKTKTVDAIHHVKNYFSAEPQQLQTIIRDIEKCAQQGIAAVRAQDHLTLGQSMNRQQVLMEKLHVNTPALEKIIDNLRSNTRILGAKISGSGLGDCAIGLGSCCHFCENCDSNENETIQKNNMINKVDVANKENEVNENHYSNKSDHDYEIPGLIPIKISPRGVVCEKI